ncbi:MAG: hypothetical protein IJJ66_01080, partial [Treponema sp.]|nr:hypothetical protein [Treponema sp.]
RARLTLRCECRDHVAVHGMYLAKVCHPASVTLNLFQGLYKLWLNILQMLNQVQHDGCMEGWGFDCALEKALS